MAQSWFKIENKGADTAAIDIFDEIGAYGVSAKDFIAQLRTHAGKAKLKLNINSPGGDCLAGFAIYDAIKDFGGEVTAHISGVAASMASVIMLAAKRITIAENGSVMVHRVTTGASGNHDELAAAAAIAKQIEDRIVGLYVDRTGKDEATVRDWMKAQRGTFFFGKDAVENGFADAVESGAKATAMKPEWAAMLTMLPRALFDTKHNTTPENINPNSMTAEEIKAAEDKLAADQKALADAQAKLAADQKALTDLAAEQADNVAKPLVVKREDIAAAVAEAVKPINAELETLRAAIKSGVAGAAGGRSAVELGNKDEGGVKTVTRAVFDAMNSKEQHAHCKAGGRITD
jgi:ATP-dependent protease ClpP protease subunit